MPSGKRYAVRAAATLLVLLALLAYALFWPWGDSVPGTSIPILMYHHFTIEAEDSAVTAQTFELQMQTLAEAGYTAVTFDQLLAYVQDGEPLPERPVCITIDDGYLSNYEIAWPILEQYGMKATIFVIGCSVGHLEHYKDTDWPITPHFSWEQALEMIESGVIDIQCHTYDLHQWIPYESGDQIRPDMLPLEGETDEEYELAVTADLQRFQAEYSAALGRTAWVLAYPSGQYCELTEEIVHSLGFSITLSTDASRDNILIPGQPESLYALGRYDVTEDVTPELLLSWVSR